MSLLLRLLSLRKSIGPQIQVCESSISGLQFFAWLLQLLVMTGMLTSIVSALGFESKANEFSSIQYDA